MDWGLYTRYTEMYGETDKERALNIAIEDFERDAVLSIAYRDDVLRNEKKQRFLVDRTDVPYKIKLVAFPGEDLFVGDEITIGNEHLIVQQTRSLNELQTTGVAWLCNYKFKFQNWSSDVIERWGVLDSGVYSTTLRGEYEVQELAKQFKIYLPYDEDTKKIFVDKRLAVGTRYDHLGKEMLEVYKVTGLNMEARSYGDGGHLLILEVRSDPYSPSMDSLEKMICDYIPPKEDEDFPAVISGRNNIALNSRRKYTIDYSSYVAWEIKDPFDGVFLTSEGSVAFISVSDTVSAVGRTITLVAKDIDGNTLDEKEIEVTAS